MKKSLFSALFSVTLASVFAQQEFCGSMTLLRQHLTQDAEADAQFSQYVELCRQAETNHALYGNSDSRALSDTIYIPVVFHVIHDGDAVGSGENISDAQIESQIDAFNENYSLSNPNAADIPDEFKLLAAKTIIRFCLAQFDVNGNPTTGITRHNLGAASWDQDSIEHVAKPATVWDRNKYLNIWTFRFGGNLGSSGTLAYAQFPPPYGGSANTDGLAVTYNCVGSVGTLLSGYNLGKTLVHESGHWLGLFHVWGDDNGLCAGQSGAGSDYIDDTPDQGNMNFGCPTYPHASCTASDMFMNHMDYSNDGCRSMFSNGQYDRMMSVLNGTLPGFSRTAIKTGGLARCYRNLDAAIASALQPDSVVCATSFSPIIYVKNFGQTDINSINISYGVDGSYTDYTYNTLLPALNNVYITLPQISGLSVGAHIFTAFITQVNGDVDNNAANDTLQTVSFTVSNQNTAFTIPYIQDFEDGSFPPDGWTILNPNNDAQKWDITYTAGGYDESSNSVWINNRSYTANPNHKKDAFILPQLDFSQTQEPRISFQYAYVNRGNFSDSLTVYYSLNCGVTWSPIFKKGGISLSTVVDSAHLTETPFVPQADEWDSVNTSLATLHGQNNVVFKFENNAGWGNALYIDNINVYDAYVPTGIDEAKARKVEVLIFPNPASQTVTVKLPENYPFTELQINDALGRKVGAQKIIDEISLVNVSNLTSGVYTITLHSNTFSQTEKLVVTK